MEKALDLELLEKEIEAAMKSSGEQRGCFGCLICDLKNAICKKCPDLAACKAKMEETRCEQLLSIENTLSPQDREKAKSRIEVFGYSKKKNRNF